MGARSARMEELEAKVAEAKRKVEQQERQARELEAEQERQVRHSHQKLGRCCLGRKLPGGKSWLPLLHSLRGLAFILHRAPGGSLVAVLSSLLLV